jgi:hypothetical protein
MYVVLTYHWYGHLLRRSEPAPTNVPVAHSVHMMGCFFHLDPDHVLTNIEPQSTFFGYSFPPSYNIHLPITLLTFYLFLVKPLFMNKTFTSGHNLSIIFCLNLYLSAKPFYFFLIKYLVLFLFRDLIFTYCSNLLSSWLNFSFRQNF